MSIVTAIRNIDRFKSDLEALLKAAGELELALLVETHGTAEVAKAFKLEDKGTSEEALKKLPKFNVSYEAWYSECFALLRQLLPDRLQDFKEHFEVPRNRKVITYATYRIQDALKGLRVTRQPYDEVVVDNKAAIPHFRQQAAILLGCQAAI